MLIARVVSTARLLAYLIPVALLSFVWSCGSDEDGGIESGTPSLAVGALTGTVRGGGALLEGASVSTIPGTVEVTTDALGRFSLSGLKAQSLTVVVSRSGYFTATKRASVVPGRTCELDFDLTPSGALGRLQGTVTDGDVPLEGVKVSTTPPSYSTVTSGDGRYDFTNVASGQYRIDASRVGFWPATVYLTAVPGEVTSGDISLGRRNDAVISGKVCDVAGNPIANAVVSLFWDSNSLSFTTGSDGAFSFDRTVTRNGSLPTGFYVVGASAVNYYSGSRSFEAYGGLDVDGTVVLNLSSVSSPVPGAIAGTVWDESWAAVSGATIVLDPSGPSPSTTTSAADGRYLFTSVDTGTHTVSVSHPDYTSQSDTVDVGSNVTADKSFNLKAVS